MFIDVIPSEHSLGTDPLTYQIEDVLGASLLPGCILEVPVKNTTEYGIFVGPGYMPPAHIEIRNISKIVTDVSVLEPYQMAVIIDISKKYFIPIHRVLGFFLTKPVLRRLQKKEFSQIELGSRNIEQKKRSPIKLIYIQNESISTKILIPYLKHRTLIVCPDDFMVYRFQQELQSHENITFLPGESTDTRRAQAWIDMRNAKYDILVGNRKILYYNLSQYDHIIYMEDAFGRDYFHYPIRIPYLDILEMISLHTSINISVLSSVPRLTTLSRFHNPHK